MAAKNFIDEWIRGYVAWDDKRREDKANADKDKANADKDKANADKDKATDEAAEQREDKANADKDKANADKTARNRRAKERKKRIRWERVA